jgi:hypothetical protein
LSHAVTSQRAESSRQDECVKWFEVSTHGVFPLSEADERTKTEAFGVSLRVSLSVACIAAVTRRCGFVKLFEEMHLEKLMRKPSRHATMFSACRGAKDEISEAEIALMRDPLNLIGIIPA